MYGNSAFHETSWEAGRTEIYEYSLPDIDGTVLAQGSYQVKLEGKEYILYVYVDTQEGKLFVCPEGVIVDFWKVGNPVAYTYIRDGGSGSSVEYYPDFYVESDWDDLKQEDDHFSEVDFDEIENLDFLKVPEGTREYYDIGLYLDVASLLKRYLEENKITGEVFYFDSDKDIICNRCEKTERKIGGSMSMLFCYLAAESSRQMLSFLTTTMMTRRWHGPGAKFIQRNPLKRT